MKNRTSLVLMEQLVMVLVFALAASVCLSVFVKADRISREIARRDAAVLLAQNSAEVMKSCAGDLEKAAQILGGNPTETGLQIRTEEMTVEITICDTQTEGLGQACIAVGCDDGELFALRTGWQEVVP